ncbi:hypothetical protein [Nodosilinea sp. FACHB-13]|uniref:hypothetical protein n=1 Tax=Cyanophyceae TaxID=3028117 RepID=UPI00168835C0|nr:hypothetical protein [Nodosilinea sp. FACHB-13]MBD2107423.1 hypothetical protein [Nodosilinea sp. FACHB-13]
MRTLTLFDPAFVARSGFDPDAEAWFAQVEAAGSVFADGAKAAYSKFFIQLKSDGNFAPFSNGMLLAFAGFSGLGGCFRPIISRGNGLPTNVGFVAGQKVASGLQGNGSAYINCGLGFLAGQQNNQSAFVWHSDVYAAPGVYIGTGFGDAGSTQLGDNTLLANGPFFRCSSSGAISIGGPRTEFDLALCQRTQGSEFFYIAGSRSGNAAVVSQVPLLLDVLMFTRNSSGSPTDITNRRLSLGGFGDALPNPGAFRTACNTLMTDLGVTP